MQFKRKISGVLAAALIVGALPSALAWETPGRAWETASSDSIASFAMMEADMLNVDFTNGTAVDTSATANSLQTFGSPVIQNNSEMGKNIAAFNGSYDAYMYPFDDVKYSKMSAGVTIESVFCYDTIPSSGEYDMFSNQQSGGIGLGLENGRLQFFCNVNKTEGGHGYVQPNAAIQAGKWYHAVGVFDGENVKLYLNGELVSSMAADGSTIHWPTGGAKNFVIGGDSGSNNDVSSFSNGSVSLARLYSQGMTDAEVKALYEQLDPAMLTVSGATCRMEQGKASDVAFVKGSNGQTATLTDITVNGQSVLTSEYDAATGKITPTQLGDYTFTYTLGSQTKTIVRACVVDATAKINLGVVSVDSMAAGVQYNVAVHVNLDEDAEASAVAFDLNYDADKLEYVGYENASADVVTKTADGTLHFAKSGLSEAAFENYAATRVAKLTFRVKDTAAAGQTMLSISNVTSENSGADVEPSVMNKTIDILAQSALDQNGDGVVGAGDVALSDSTGEAEAIAAAAAIYPYKHAVVITMDGGGICFRPDAMYYVQGGKTVLTSDPAILAKRTNDYAMQLFNKEFATSYEAQSETPTISAQNYTAILHGKEYKTAQSEYKIDNNKAGTLYYPDFGKETPVYPSVFKALGAAFPQRGNAAFAEWTQIINGIVEPDAPVYTHGSTKNTGDLQDVANYIRSDAFNKTAMVYMQSDYMDGVGHGGGYYTDHFYTGLKRYDAYFKAIMDALEETGAKDETLVLVNSDHGGTAGGSHGGTTAEEYDVQIGMGGQTIDSGKKLTGGTNHDPSVIALTALRAQVPASMDGSADLFEQANLDQTELISKKRDIEKVTLNAVQNTKNAVITLTNAKQQTRAADMVLDLGGKTVTDIRTEGKIVRRELKDGKLFLTVKYDEQPQTLAVLTFSEPVDSGIRINEIMLGTSKGGEIYCDLANTCAEGEVPSAGVEASVSGLDRVNMGAEVSFRFSLAKMERVAAATLTFEVSDKNLVEDGKLIGQNGFKLLDGIKWTEEDDKLIGKLTLSYLENGSLTNEALTDIARLTFTAADQTGKIAIKLTGAQIAGYDVAGNAVYLNTTVTTPEAVTVIGSGYDVNMDGKIDLLDIAHAQKFYQFTTASENWAQAKNCDVNDDGTIDLEDLIAILHAYTA